MERYHFLINELVSSDGQLGPTLRALYDSDACNPAEFLGSLNEFIDRTDGDIEKICNKYYQGFIQSIDELLRVRSNAQSLKDIISEMGTTATTSAQPLIEASETLIALRKVQRNILTTIETLTNSLPIIQLYCKATSQLKEKKFYPALKSLDELEQLYLTPDITYSFADKMRERVPQLRAQVSQTAFDDLQGFLTDIRDRATKIGETAMKQALTSTAADTGGTSSPDTNSDVCASDQVQFNLLYRSLHIYGVLGKRQTGESYYKVERKKQAALVLEPFATMTDLAESEAYKQCFYQVAGFFIVEHTVLGTAQSLLSKQWVDDLWDQAVREIARVMQQRLKACTKASTICEVKRLIVDFCQTLNGYGYNCNRVYGICVKAKEPYTAVLLNQCASRFKEVFLKDNYAQYVATDEEEHNAITQQFPYRDRVLEEAPFPRVFPFSKAVPEIYKVIIEFIETSVTFVEDLDLSNTEIDESVRKSTNYLLSKTLSGTLSQVIRTKHLSLQQLTQISVNTTALQDACKSLEKKISSITHSVGDDMHLQHLHGASVFKDARAAAEEKLFDVLKEQIDQFMELSEFDWAPATPMAEPSPYMYDMLAYLTTVFASLTHMPVEVARHAYFQTCKYIAFQLLLSLNGPATANVNHNGFEAFALDLEMCEEYALNCPISTDETDDGMFGMVFNKLRQLVSVFLDWDLEGVLDPATKTAKYPNLPASDVLLVMRRFEIEVEGGAKPNRRTIRREGKKKKQQSGDIIKRLEVLVAGPDAQAAPSGGKEARKRVGVRSSTKQQPAPLTHPAKPARPAPVRPPTKRAQSSFFPAAGPPSQQQKPASSPGSKASPAPPRRPPPPKGK